MVPLSERQSVIDDCRQRGMTWPEIADVLGITHGSLRNWRDGQRNRKTELAMPTTPRDCLRCGSEFGSTGAGHRLCDECRTVASAAHPLMPVEGGARGRRVAPILRGGVR